MLISKELADIYINEEDNDSLEYSVKLIKDGIETIINNEEINPPIDYKSGFEKFPIGSLLSSTLSVSIRGELSKEFYDDIEYDIQLIIKTIEGDLVSKPFKVEKATYDVRENETRFECKDKIVDLLVKYEALPTTFPTTFGEYTKRWLDKHEFKYIQSDLDNLYNKDFVMNDFPNLGDGDTELNLGEGISKMALSMTYLDFFGNFRIKRLSSLLTDDGNISIIDGIKDYKASKDRFKTLGINTLELKMSEHIDGESAKAYDESMIDVDGVVPLVLSEIPFLLDNEQRQSVVQDMFNEIKSFKYKAYELESKYWFMDLGDVFFNDLDGENKLPIFKISTSHQGSAMTTLSAVSESYEENKRPINNLNPRKKIEANVDKLNAEFKVVGEEVDEISKKTSELSQSVDSISLKVDEINLGNLIPNLNGQFGYAQWYGDGDLTVTDDLEVKGDMTAGLPAIIVDIEGSLVPQGWEFRDNNRLFTPYGVVLPTTYDFSWRGKVINSKPFVLTIYEYSGKSPNGDYILLRSRDFSMNNNTQYQEITTQLDPNARYVQLSFNVPTATLSNRMRLTEMMFNEGSPKSYYETANDAVMYAQSVLDLTSEKISLSNEKIDKLTGDIHNTLVNVDGVKGLTVQGNNNQGITVFNKFGEKVISLDGDGNVMSKKMIAEDIIATGIINAIRGEIGNFEIEDGVLSYTSPEYEREYTYADLSSIRNIIMNEKKPSEYELYIYDVTGDGIINSLDYMQISNYLKGDRDKPKSPMIKSRVQLGTNDGKVISTVLYDGDKIGVNTTIQADNIKTGTIELNGMSFKGKAVEVDSNGFLKLV